MTDELNMTGVQNLNGSTAIQPIVTELPPQKAKVEVLQTGMGSVQHPRRRSGMNLMTFVGLGLIGLASMFMATPTYAQGAPLDSKTATPIEIGVEQPAELKATAQWHKVDLSAEQAVVSRRWEGGELKASIDLYIPWGADKAEITSAEMLLFADGPVKAKVEQGVLHLSYEAAPGIQASLQQGKGVIQLHSDDAATQLLTVTAPEVTVDDTAVYLHEQQNYLGNLSESAAVYAKFGQTKQVAETEATIAEVQGRIDAIKAGDLTQISVWGK